MANLKEEAKWEEGIYQYELDDPLQGGEDGIDNVQGRQLANRTLYLKKMQEDIDVTMHRYIEDDELATSIFVDERKCRNLLDVLGIRAVHSSAPATLDEIKKAMAILHKKINAGGVPDFSGLRLGDYLDLPELHDGNTTYRWNAAYINLRIMIAAFNIYKYNQFPYIENHIVFIFRNCVSKRKMNDSAMEYNVYAESQLATYLADGFARGLDEVLGHILYPIQRHYKKNNGFDLRDQKVFLPTAAEVWGGVGYPEYTVPIGFCLQYPIFSNSMLYRYKSYNGSGYAWWNATQPDVNSENFMVTRSDGGLSSYQANNLFGVSPAFCIS